ncbi:hypothetical protein [Natrinema salifodinae]|uniref:hypothetical protein n=1 Tax=Natrinema salifodinae TaxID=1202768 RepID=UPI001160B225|nr:hypothetical protein [Natrinema salifodinae]
MSVLSLVLDTSARRTYYFTTASVLAILSLFVYAFARLFSVDLLGRTYVTPEIAVVVYLSSSFVLRYAYQGNHLPYAIFFLMIILYLTYRVLFWSDTDSYAMYVLLLLAYLSLIVTHHYTTAMGLLLVLVLFVTSRSRRVLLVTFAAGVFTLLHWGWIADVNGLDLVVTNVVPLFRDFGFSDPTSASTDQPLSVLLYTTIGTALVLLFAQIGLLLGIRSSRVQTVSLVTVCYFLLGLIGVGVIVGTEGLSPNRIFFISQVLFLPALCASGIVLLGSRRILLFGTVTIVLVSALTVAGPAPAFETAILGNDVPNSKTFQTTNERAAIEWYDDVGDTDDRVYTSRSYVDFRTGTAMFRPHLEESTVDARMIPVADDEYNKTDIEDDEIYFHTIYDKEIGYRPELESSRRVGQAETTQISDRSVDEIRTRNDNVYSNQVVEVYK